jgi:glycosyltransferase involved in cell wall biosynthesis
MKNVTILIPAYNEVKFIETAILSAASQAEFVIVSDNNSTDGTKEVCRDLAKKIENLIFIEQKKNLGSIKNWSILYDQVKTDYVISMGAHDIMSESYVAELMKCYEKNPDAVLVYAPAKLIDEKGTVFGEFKDDRLAKGFSSHDAFKRVYTNISNDADCSIQFALVRRDTMLRNLYAMPFAGIDRAIFNNLAREGRFIRCDSTCFYNRWTNRKDTDEAYMRRLVGDTTYSMKRDYYRLCEEYFRTIKNIKTKNFIKKLYYYYRAKRFLKSQGLI